MTLSIASTKLALCHIRHDSGQLTVSHTGYSSLSKLKFPPVQPTRTRRVKPSLRHVGRSDQRQIYTLVWSAANVAPVEGTAQSHSSTRLPSGGESPRGVVITGGSKGLGYALAAEFLRHGHDVAICGRNEEQLDAAIQSLGKFSIPARVFGAVCDVSNPADVTAFGAFVKEHLGLVDIWINNAGEVTGKQLLADVDPAEIVRVASTNVIGSLLCSREALRLMREQPRAASMEASYHLFNLGFSRWGAKFTKSVSTHKATKVALTQLTTTLQEELQAAGLKGVGVHNLSPGMVLTDLLLKDSTPVARRFFNALAEEPEVVAESLVPQILAVKGTGQSVDFLSPGDALWKVLTRVTQILYGGRFFDKNGERVRAEGSEYLPNGVRRLF